MHRVDDDADTVPCLPSSALPPSLHRVKLEQYRVKYEEMQVTAVAAQMEVRVAGGVRQEGLTCVRVRGWGGGRAGQVLIQ